MGICLKRGSYKGSAEGLVRFASKGTSVFAFDCAFDCAGGEELSEGGAVAAEPHGPVVPKQTLAHGTKR